MVPWSYCTSGSRLVVVVVKWNGSITSNSFCCFAWVGKVHQIVAAITTARTIPKKVRTGVSSVLLRESRSLSTVASKLVARCSHHCAGRHKKNGLQGNEAIREYNVPSMSAFGGSGRVQRKPKSLLSIFIGPASNSLPDLMGYILHSGIRDGGSYGSAHEIPLSHTRFCSTALDFGNELCSPRVTTFAECSGETP
jgi:hypothetical protein